VDHRRFYQPARLRRPDPLEPGVLPPCPGILRRAFCEHGFGTEGFCHMVIDARQAIAEGRTALGIELGSTRIKAVLTDEDHAPLAGGSHDWENQFVDRIWTYPLDSVWTGLQ